MAKAKAKTSQARLKADNTYKHTPKLVTKWRLEYAYVCVCVRVCCHGSRQMKTPVALRPKMNKETEKQQEKDKEREEARKIESQVRLTLRLFYLAAFSGDNNRQNGRQ